MQRLKFWAVLMGAACNVAAQTPSWRPDHTVIVILENLSAHEATPAQRSEGNAPVYGPSNWNFFNQLADKGARFTRASFGQTPYGSGLPTRPSQPNYLFLFSAHHQGVLPGWFQDERSPYQGTALYTRQGGALKASTQGPVGVANNTVPDRWLPFTSPNLGAAIMKSGGSFASFSESLPYPSWNCGTDSSLVPCEQSWALTDLYRRKHNPAINWTDQLAPTSQRGLHGDLQHNVLPVSVNLGFDPTRDPVLKRSFRGFAKDEKGQRIGFDQLPTVSIVVPNEQNDAHSNSAEAADGWLQRNIEAYAQWAMTHNSLLILTFDEDGSTDKSKGDPYVSGRHSIPTVFYGAGVKPGVYDQAIDHLNVLSTVLWLHGALDQFQKDFRQYHGVRDGSGSEAELEALNLKPITQVFAQPAK
ncbi:MAG TPA: alkaline phosphatase family protein [Aquabacterium sp.]|nr:alkaline phosphatase family protein [Aquabacterium sp.]